jgi:hypothetical protein
MISPPVGTPRVTLMARYSPYWRRWNIHMAKSPAAAETLCSHVPVPLGVPADPWWPWKQPYTGLVSEVTCSRCQRSLGQIPDFASRSIIRHPPRVSEKALQALRQFPQPMES